MAPVLSTLALAAAVVATTLTAPANAEQLALHLAEPKLHVVQQVPPKVYAHQALTPELPFEEFKVRFHRSYANAAEEAERRAQYERNMAKARAYQKTNPLATFGPNEYADWSEAEMRAMKGMPATAMEQFRAGLARQALRIAEGKQKLRAAKLGAAPSAVNWVNQGAVTPVKNQGQCGDCWAFSTTGNIEGQWFLAGNALVSLSEQELTSCDTNDTGCNGGLPWQAMEWLLSSQQGWITSEADYPFVSGSGTAPACAFSSASMPGAAQISNYQQLPSNDEANMQQFCGVYGPLSIGVDATSFQSYTGGVLTSCTSNQVDHAVLAVGYDLTYSTPYWIIKNSWGASWGEAGYIRVAYGSNQCLLSAMPSSAEVA